jgi:membrane protein YdbS with pleckstrin-like domain
MPSNYYILINNAPFGPYTEEQMRQMAAGGQVNPATLVFQVGGAQQWFPAAQFPNLLKKPQGKGFFAPNVGVSVPVTTGGIESTVWEGRPSLWMIFDRFFFPSIIMVSALIVTIAVQDDIDEQLFGALLAMVVLAVVILLLSFLVQLVKLKSTSWKLTTERLCLKSGVFSHKVRNLELFRVKDIGLHKPFVLRLVGLGYVDYHTSDPSEKKGVIGAVYKPDDVFAVLRKYVNRQRQMKGVQEVDVHGV